MSRNFLIILVAIIVVLGGVFFLGKGKSDNGSGGSSSGQATSHISGQGKKGITLMEYGDYECPVCYSYYPVVKQVAAKYNEDIYFQFRNLPLSQIHPNAFAGARAAEAAGLQGKYFEMHDLLYENQDPNGQTGWVASSDALDNYFVGFASQLGLNTAKFKQDFSSSTVNDAINADVAAFNKTGQQTATPTFFINGVYVNNTKLIDNNGPSVDKFSAVIDAAIAAKNK